MSHEWRSSEWMKDTSFLTVASDKQITVCKQASKCVYIIKAWLDVLPHKYWIGSLGRCPYCSNKTPRQLVLPRPTNPFKLYFLIYVYTSFCFFVCVPHTHTLEYYILLADTITRAGDLNFSTVTSMRNRKKISQGKMLKMCNRDVTNFYSN